MQAKVFEVRDRATFIPVLAVRLAPQGSQEAWLMERAGYDPGTKQVLLSKLAGGPQEYDPHAWGDRTMQVAHLFIQQDWDQLAPGVVVDVEWILGESKTRKDSERLLDLGFAPGSRL